MEKRIKLIKEELPIMVLIYDNGEYSLFNEKGKTFKTVEEFKSAYYLPESYSPVILDIVESNKATESGAWN